jgi:hypothetical protein
VHTSQQSEVFMATHDTVTFELTGKNDADALKAIENQSWAILEELPHHQETDQWTP